MKHSKVITKAPRQAQSMTTGGIIMIISQLLAVVGQFFNQKDATQSTS